MRGTAVEICERLSAEALHAAAKACKCGRAAGRMTAIANALAGMTRMEAAASVGLERQALRDAILAYNEDGLDGLYDRPRSGRPCKLDTTAREALFARIRKGPDPETDGRSTDTLDDLCAFVKATFGVTYRADGLSQLIKKNGFSRQKPRPLHPKTDLASHEAFKKRSRRFETNCRYT